MRCRKQRKGKDKDSPEGSGLDRVDAALRWTWQEELRGEAKSRLQLAECQPVGICMFSPEIQNRGRRIKYTLRTKGDISQGELRE